MRIIHHRSIPHALARGCHGFGRCRVCSQSLLQPVALPPSAGAKRVQAERCAAVSAGASASAIGPRAVVRGGSEGDAGGEGDGEEETKEMTDEQVNQYVGVSDNVHLPVSE